MTSCVTVGGWGRETPAHLPAAPIPAEEQLPGAAFWALGASLAQPSLPSRQVQTCPGLAGQICRFCLTLGRRPLIEVCGTRVEMAHARPSVPREVAQAGRASTGAQLSTGREAGGWRLSHQGRMAQDSPVLFRRQALRRKAPCPRPQNYKPRDE